MAVLKLDEMLSRTSIVTRPSRPCADGRCFESSGNQVQLHFWFPGTGGDARVTIEVLESAPIYRSVKDGLWRQLWLRPNRPWYFQIFPLPFLPDMGIIHHA
jgi:hypothetical protein